MTKVHRKIIGSIHSLSTVNLITSKPHNSLRSYHTAADRRLFLLLTPDLTLIPRSYGNNINNSLLGRAAAQHQQE